MSRIRTNRFREALRGALLLALLVLLLAAAPAGAETEVDRETREIARDMRCVICNNLSVADSPSDLAADMRAIIRQQLEAGRSRQEIEEYMVARWGEQVLLNPPARGFNLLVWGGPILVLLAGLVIVGYALNRWSARRPAPAPQPSADEMAEYDDLLREDMRRLGANE